jgi:hypothetical protein
MGFPNKLNDFIFLHEAARLSISVKFSTRLFVSVNDSKLRICSPRSVLMREIWLLLRSSPDKRLHLGKFSSFLISLSVKSSTSN